MSYIACALIPIQKDRVDEYTKISERVAAVWMDHGALRVREFVGDDFDVKDSGARPMPEVAGLEDGETMVLATVEFESARHRAEVEATFHEDPRLGDIFADGMPFDPSRITGAAFAGIVEE